MLLSALCVSACGQIVQTDALFMDVARRPPDASVELVEAISAEREFAEWVVYMDTMCDLHGCI